MIKAIVAVDSYGGIGKDGMLPWHIPSDLKQFKKYTTGNIVIMGRRTFESLPNGPLPNRINVVLSKTVDKIPGCEVVGSVEEALELVGEMDAWVIGGAEIYKAFEDHIDQYRITVIDKWFMCDTTLNFQPDRENWYCSSMEIHNIGEALPYEVFTYARKGK